MGPGSKMKRSQLMFSSAFSKALYKVLVVGETISVVGHFKLALFHIWVCFFLFFLFFVLFLFLFFCFFVFAFFFLTLDLFLKVTSALNLFFAINWHLIIIVILIIFYVLSSKTFCVFVKFTNFNICDVINIAT